MEHVSNHNPTIQPVNEMNATLWKETKEMIKAKFDKLTNIQINSLRDNFGLLHSHLIKAYSYSNEQAKTESDSFISNMVPHKSKAQIKLEKDYPNMDEMSNEPEQRDFYE